MCAAEDIIAVCHEGGSEITQVKLSLKIQFIKYFPWHSSKYSFKVQILIIFISD